MAQPRIGIALGSGGARGWIHIGVLQALKDAGIEPDIVAGCSMGALVGGAYVAGWLDDLEEWASTISRRDIVRLLDVDISSGGLIDGMRIKHFLQDFKGDARIEYLAKPYMAVATDLYTGREIWLREGSLSNAIRASISIPGLFKPYELDGMFLLDGGLTNPVPVSACRALGADIIIAVNPNADRLNNRHRGMQNQKDHAVEKTIEDTAESYPAALERLLDSVPDIVKNRVKSIAHGLPNDEAQSLGYFDVISSSLDIMTDVIMRSRFAGEPPHIVLNPDLGSFSTLEFNRAGEAISEGRRIVHEALPDLQKLVG